MSTNQESIEWYNQKAADYTAHVRNPDDSIYHSLYEKPAMYSLLPDLIGKDVLSLGCGSGEDSRYLKKQGAKKSVGIDIAKGMIEIANKTPEECEFQVMDMEHLDFPDSSFDFIYSSLAIHYIENWSQVMREAYRILRSGGEFLFSCNHPVSYLEKTEEDESHYLRQMAKYKDKTTGEIKITGDYINRKGLRGPEDFAVTTWYKSFGEISSEISQSGFLINNIVEPRPDPKMQKLAPGDYETLNKIPAFAIFKLIKLPK